MARRAFCDGIARRDFLRVAAAGVLLPSPLARGAVAPAPRRDLSLIYLFLHGGLSTIDTFDLKPGAPSEFRGEFGPIATSVPGVQVCEHLPRVARQMHRL